MKDMNDTTVQLTRQAVQGTRMQQGSGSCTISILSSLATKLTPEQMDRLLSISPRGSKTEECSVDPKCSVNSIEG